jgi:hypothetical protein
MNLILTSSNYTDRSIETPFWESWALTKNSTVEVVRESADPRLHWSCSRLITCKKILETCQPVPKWILLADIRDVVFLKDPFDFNFQPGISVALENHIFKRSRGNLKWMWMAGGVANVKRFWNRHVSNAGTIVGDYAAIMEYLDFTLYHIKRNFWARYYPIDQSLLSLFTEQCQCNVHNYTNSTGPYVTMDSCKPEDAFSNPQATIVHQYDRVGLKWNGKRLTL